LITLFDIKEIIVRIWQRGIHSILQKIGSNSKARTQATFDHQYTHANWWLLPQVHACLHKRMHIEPFNHYMLYVKNWYYKTYNTNTVRIVSIGCGNGSQEMQWAAQWPEATIMAYDITPNNIAIANAMAQEKQLSNIYFETADWYTLPETTFDIILFHSSLHHLKNMPEVMAKVKRMLSANGIFVIHEYVGPNKNKFETKYIKAVNKLLANTPKQYRKIWNTPFYKSHAGRGGALRMWLNDPSEAIESERILPLIHQNFNAVKEEPLGSNLFVLYLKEIAHHFLNTTHETEAILHKVLNLEAEMIQRKDSYFVFGIYQSR
jgi:ubiquinone/menaquinone biosynthesis C-methylase UbiE